MGVSQSKRSTKHLLYNYHPLDNKIYYYNTRSKEPYQLNMAEVFFMGEKFNLGGQETISTDDDCIYICGGMLYDRNVSNIGKVENVSVGMNVYKQSESLNTHAIPSGLLGVIDKYFF